MSEMLSIGEVAAATDLRVEAIRYYERLGLIPKAPRRASGYRMFPQETVARIRFIRRAKELGFSLDEIDELLSLRNAPQATREDVRERAEAKLRDVRAKIESLQQIERALGNLTETCQGDTGPACQCPILDALEE